MGHPGPPSLGGSPSWLDGQPPTDGTAPSGGDAAAPPAPPAAPSTYESGGASSSGADWRPPDDPLGGGGPPEGDDDNPPDAGPGPEPVVQEENECEGSRIHDRIWCIHAIRFTKCVSHTRSKGCFGFPF